MSVKRREKLFRKLRTLFKWEFSGALRQFSQQVRHGPSPTRYGEVLLGTATDEMPQCVSFSAAYPCSNLNTATLARRFGQRRTAAPFWMPNASRMRSPSLRASTSKSA